jgi:hypothetical protein
MNDSKGMSTCLNLGMGSQLGISRPAPATAYQGVEANRPPSCRRWNGTEYPSSKLNFDALQVLSLLGAKHPNLVVFCPLTAPIPRESSDLDS